MKKTPKAAPAGSRRPGRAPAARRGQALRRRQPPRRGGPRPAPIRALTRTRRLRRRRRRVLAPRLRRRHRRRHRPRRRRQQGDDLLPLRRQARALSRHRLRHAARGRRAPSRRSPNAERDPPRKLARFIAQFVALADEPSLLSADDAARDRRGRAAPRCRTRWRSCAPCSPPSAASSPRAAGRRVPAGPSGARLHEHARPADAQRRARARRRAARVATTYRCSSTFLTPT